MISRRVDQSQPSSELRSAGLNLRSPHENAIQGEWELKVIDLNPNITSGSEGTDDCDGVKYNVNKVMNFTFKEGMRYAFEISINGELGIGEPFSVTLAAFDPVDLTFNWLISSSAGVVGVILLTANVANHHWCWLILASCCGIGLLVALPLMTLHQDGHSNFFAS